MNWLQRVSQRITPTMLIPAMWHATTSALAERINESGVIKPSMQIENETGERLQGWNFSESEGEYGDGVYLAKTPEEALYYANIRLKKERDNFEPNEESDLYDEDFEYLGLYRVRVPDANKLVEVGMNEYKYKGEIISHPDGQASFEFIKFVPRTRDANEWRSKIERSNGEMGEEPEQILH